jgi:DNA-binding XRE family transcriptional regulator
VNCVRGVGAARGVLYGRVGPDSFVLAFARAVAERLVVYRAEHGLTQTQLACQAGTVQSVVARLERGDHAPSLATLVRLSQRLGIEFHIQITPGHVGLSA